MDLGSLLLIGGGLAIIWVIFALLLFVLWIYAIVSAISRGKWLWLLFIIIIPLLGMFLYLLLGRGDSSRNVAQCVGDACNKK